MPLEFVAGGHQENQPSFALAQPLVVAAVLFAAPLPLALPARPRHCPPLLALPRQRRGTGGAAAACTAAGERKTPVDYSECS